MLLVEKVLLLKSTDIFSGTPEQELIDIAHIMEDMELEKGITLFEKGEVGKSMYLIYKGSVRVHDGSHEFAQLGENEIFGELSVLDAEPRSASVTTLSDCGLLKLDQEPLFEVLRSNPKILTGILHTLCRRLRVTDQNSVAISKQFSPFLKA